ncbi:MAG: glutamine amidotransferase-related protein [Bacteroidota bacterium]
MHSSDSAQLRVAILDLYNGAVNQGMRCLIQILNEWSRKEQIELTIDQFDVRQLSELPGLEYDVYVSTGGPGDPLSSRYKEWDIQWCRWLDRIIRHNANPNTQRKKFVFFICHSFQLACRHLNLGMVCKRHSTAFGVFPVHRLEGGKQELIFEGLQDPFYAVDSRDYQVIHPNEHRLEEMGGMQLCLEKERPHVLYERALMAARINPWMVGTQFHPEADPEGMRLYLLQEEKKQQVIKDHGEPKWKSMLDQLEDEDKIRLTHLQVIPNFLNQAAESLLEVAL